jgi:Tol biopolymer transport system component
LYLLDLHRLTVRQLTHNPHVDFFSRFSPDGRRVLFLRSQREWVSFREEGAWDVMLVTTLRRHRDEMSESGSGADEVGPQIRLLPGIDYALGASLSAAGLSRQERL